MMGLDLALLPIFSKNSWYSHDVIRISRRPYEFMELILKIEKEKGILVPPNFDSYLSRDDKYEESHYGETLFTPYGDPVKWVMAIDLLQLKDHEEVNNNWRNKAVWAYLKELPTSTKIALFWS